MVPQTVVEAALAVLERVLLLLLPLVQRTP
jgi:hypothetical protein